MEKEGKGDKRHAQTGCWSVHLCGRDLCLITAVCPVFLLNSVFLGEELLILCACVFEEV